MFVPGKPLQPIQMFTKVKHILEVPLLGRLIHWGTNIKVGWYGLQETISPAYYKNLKITEKQAL